MIRAKTILVSSRSRAGEFRVVEIGATRALYKYLIEGWAPGSLMISVGPFVTVFGSLKS